MLVVDGDHTENFGAVAELPPLTARLRASKELAKRPMQIAIIVIEFKVISILSFAILIYLILADIKNVSVRVK